MSKSGPKFLSKKSPCLIKPIGWIKHNCLTQTSKTCHASQPIIELTHELDLIERV
jgi:hypothetical protein